MLCSVLVQAGLMYFKFLFCSVLKTMQHGYQLINIINYMVNRSIIFRITVSKNILLNMKHCN
jgi:hypothetical protein